MLFYVLLMNKGFDSSTVVDITTVFTTIICSLIVIKTVVISTTVEESKPVL